MSMSAATGAPAPVRIAGKEYTAAAVDFDGIGELEEYARAFILSVATKAAEDLSPVAAKTLIDAALDKATSVSFDSRKFKEYLMSGRGMVTLLSISLRARHPGMTRAAVGELTKGHDADLIAAVETVLRISGFGDGEEKSQPQQGGTAKGEAGAGA